MTMAFKRNVGDITRKFAASGQFLPPIANFANTLYARVTENEPVFWHLFATVPRVMLIKILAFLCKRIRELRVSHPFMSSVVLIFCEQAIVRSIDAIKD